MGKRPLLSDGIDLIFDAAKSSLVVNSTFSKEMNRSTNKKMEEVEKGVHAKWIVARCER